MIWSIAAAVQLAAQPLPAEIAYLPLAGETVLGSAPIDALARSIAAGSGTTFRRARHDASALEACLRRSSLPDDADHCIRGLLPRGDAGAPIVVLFLEEDRRSNITGTIVRKSLDMRCIGTRGIGRAELGTSLAAPGEMERAREPVRQCIANALRIPEQATIDPATGAAEWRFPVRADGLLRDTALARGNGLERAIVEIEERGAPGEAAGGDCALFARVSRVLGGWWLRDGDRIALGLPCGTNGVRNGRSAHLMIGYDRKILYLEAL